MFLDKQVKHRIAVGTRKRPSFISGCQVAPAADRSVSRPPAAVADATRYGRRRCYYDRAPPLLRLLQLLMYRQFGY